MSVYKRGFAYIEIQYDTADEIVISERRQNNKINGMFKGIEDGYKNSDE